MTQKWLPVTMISWLFDTPKSSVSRYLITWTNLLCVFPSEYFYIAKKSKYYKKCLKHSKLHILPILHCIKTFFQNPSSLFPQISLYSSHQYHVTYKGLLSIAPSGSKSFIKELYAGCILHTKKN